MHIITDTHKEHSQEFSTSFSGRLTDGIRKKKRFRPPPPPPLPIPPDPDIATLHKPGLRDQGRSMVHSVGEGCNMQ